MKFITSNIKNLEIINKRQSEADGGKFTPYKVGTACEACMFTCLGVSPSSIQGVP